MGHHQQGLPAASRPAGGPRALTRSYGFIVAEELGLSVVSLAALFLAGATIGLISLLLPHARAVDLSGLYSNVIVAYIGGLVLIVVGRHIRGWMLQVGLVAGELLITRAVILSHDPVSLYAVWYIWVGLYAFYFCRRRVAALHLALVAALYAATLVNQPPSSPVARWLTTVTTLIVAGVLIDTLVRRARAQTAVALESASSMTQVTELAHQLVAISDGPGAREALCAGALRVTQATWCGLWETSAEGPVARMTAATTCAAEARLDGEVDHAREAEPEVPPPGALAALSEGQATGLRRDGSQAPLAEDFDHDHEITRLWYPILQETTVVAVLELEWQRPGGAGPTALAMAKLLAAEAAVTLHRVALYAELEAIARTDELTGLPNRRAWQEQLAREMARAARSGDTLSVAMLDLDRFKDYNDALGHQSGDRLLKQVASLWCAQLRPTDVLARYGGEEFALAVSGRSTKEAEAVVQRLRVAMPEAQTCSAGIASWNGVETAAALLERADRALYTAKGNGRDQIAVALASAAPVGDA